MKRGQRREHSGSNRLVRILWYGLLAVSFVAGRYTGRREWFLVFFILSLVALAGLILNLWTIFSFSYTQEASRPVAVKGTTPRLAIGIYNDKPFPFTLMRVRADAVIRSQEYQMSFNLSPRSSIRFDIPLHCAYRGVYEVGMTSLEVNDIFGLVRTPFHMKMLPYYRQSKIKVYPRLLPVAALPARTLDAKLTAGGVMRVSDDGDSYSDLRAYRPGDPLKRVHRVASARYRELYVKSYDIPLETAVIVALDTAADYGRGEDALYLEDLACECAAAVGAYCLRAGYILDLVEADPARPVLRCQSQQDFPRLYNELAILPFQGQGDLALRLEERLRRGGTALRALYLISPAEPGSCGPVLARLAREGCGVKHLRLSQGGELQPGGIPGVSRIRVRPGDNIAELLAAEAR